MIWILVVLAALGAAAAAAGMVALRRDGRRMSALIFMLVGAGTALLATALVLAQRGYPTMLYGLAIAAVVVLLLGNLLGYPILVVFLLWSGVTVLRKESRTLGNALALLAGLVLLFLPTTLGLLAPPGVVRDDPAYIARYAAHGSAVLVVGYLAVAFAAFLGASLLYRWRKSPAELEAIVVLGSGLINGQVPPLLAARLQRALEAQRAQRETPTIITSGGQGPDEPRPEGLVMRNYLIEHGAVPDRVLAETESRNTAENLRLSRELLPAPESPILVVTSSYHVFRAALLTRTLGLRAHVIGARTAWYYLPSAVLREFVGVLRDRWRWHAIAVTLLVAFATAFSIVVVPMMGPPPGT